MRDFTRVLGIRIVAAHQFDGVLEAADVEEPHVEGKKHRADDQP